MPIQPVQFPRRIPFEIQTHISAGKLKVMVVKKKKVWRNKKLVLNYFFQEATNRLFNKWLAEITEAPHIEPWQRKNLTCYVKPHFFLRLSRNHKWAIRNSIALHGKNKRYHRLLLSISFCPLRSIWCRSESSSLSLGWSLFQESVVCCIIHWCVLSCQATMQWGYITVRWKQQKPNFAF